MSSGPENRFIDAIHRRLKGLLHFEKMHNPYRGGTADVWYSGPESDIWIEYKWLNKVPVKKPVKPALSGLQREWLRDRYNEGRRVYVVIGNPAGGMLFLDPKEWEEGLTASQRKTSPKHVLADWIRDQVGNYTSGDKDAENSSGLERRAVSNVVGTQDRPDVVHAVRVSKVRKRKI